MNGKVTQEEINKVVWQACDTFRGVIDPSQYKDYILTMLFLKYVSDVSKAKYKEYLQRYDGDTERAQRAMRRERFQVPEKSSFDYLFEHRNEPNIGELIDIALADLEFANREKLSSEDGSGIFRNISFNSSNLGETKERNARLKQLLIDFSDERLQFDESHLANNDVIGDAYMFLIEKFASDAGKKAGEFFTPKEVSTLLARLTKSAPGSRICDPTCGSGSLLIKAGREVGSDNFSLYGQELNGSTWALAMMNMLLHGFDSATIRWGDTLRNPKLKEGDALPSIRLLAKELRISVITTKRAYEDLEKAGFINTVPGKGCFVAPQNMELHREETLKKMEGYLQQAVDTALAGGISKAEVLATLNLLLEGD